MLYSKNGSIPKPETDGTEGWVEVPYPPVPPEGMEVVWWCPPGWVVRPPEPEPVEGYVWKWSQTNEEWIDYPLPGPTPPPPPPPQPTAMPSADIYIGSSADITLDFGSAGVEITIGSAMPE